MAILKGSGIQKWLSLILLLPAAAWAQPVVISASWEYPITRMDGSVLDIEDVAHVDVYVNGEHAARRSPPAQEAQFEIEACSQAVLTATATDTAGLVSDHSPAFNLTICPPTAPRITGVSVP